MVLAFYLHLLTTCYSPVCDWRSHITQRAAAGLNAERYVAQTRLLCHSPRLSLLLHNAVASQRESPHRSTSKNKYIEKLLGDSDVWMKLNTHPSASCSWNFNEAKTMFLFVLDVELVISLETLMLIHNEGANTRDGDKTAQHHTAVTWVPFVILKRPPPSLFLLLKCFLSFFFFWGGAGGGVVP